MRLGLHIAKVWTACALIFLTTFAAIAGGYALFQQEWRDRLSGGTAPVTVTIVGQHRNQDGCGRKITTPGWDWEATWVDEGTTRHGTLRRCAQAPIGARIETYVTDSGALGGDSTTTYYVWWPILSVGLGGLLMIAWFTGNGRERLQQVRREAQTG